MQSDVFLCIAASGGSAFVEKKSSYDPIRNFRWAGRTPAASSSALGIKESVMGPIESFYDGGCFLQAYYGLFFRGGVLGDATLCIGLPYFESPEAVLPGWLAWCAWQELNLQPRVPKTRALSS